MRAFVTGLSAYRRMTLSADVLAVEAYSVVGGTSAAERPGRRRPGPSSACAGGKGRIMASGTGDGRAGGFGQGPCNAVQGTGTEVPSGGLKMVTNTFSSLPSAFADCGGCPRGGRGVRSTAAEARGAPARGQRPLGGSAIPAA